MITAGERWPIRYLIFPHYLTCICVEFIESPKVGFFCGEVDGTVEKRGRGFDGTESFGFPVNVTVVCVYGVEVAV